MESLFRCLAWVLTAVLWTVLLGVPLALQIPPALAAPWVLISLAAFAWLYLWRRDPAARRALWRSFRLTPTHLHFSWLALAAIATSALNVSCALLLVPQSESSGAELIEKYLALPGGFALMALVVLVYSPVVEETIFRGRLLPILRPSLGRVGAIVTSAALFAALHGGQVGGMVGRFALGLAAGAVVLASGSLWAAIAIHVVNNGVALLFFQTAAPPSLGAPYPLLAVVLSGTSLALALRGLAHASGAA